MCTEILNGCGQFTLVIVCINVVVIWALLMTTLNCPISSVQ